MKIKEYEVVAIPSRKIFYLFCFWKIIEVSVTTKREVFCGVISQGVTPYFFMEEKICTFFGHRNVDVTEELRAITETEILDAIKLGCNTFYFGGFGDFDALCYEIVTKIKEERDELEIKRVYYVPQERELRKTKVKRDNYEDIIYLMPSFDGWYKSIYYRNCAMVDVIFYAEERADSGAYKALKYARKKRANRIVNLWGRDV